MDISKKLDRILKKTLAQYNELETILSKEENISISTSELKELIMAIDQSYESQETKIQQAERSLEISGRELEESNQKLFHTNRTMGIVLDSLNEGLILFNTNGNCSQFSSAAAADHFQKNFSENGIMFKDLFPEKIKSDVSEWIELIFSGKFQFNQINDLGPNWVPSLENRKIEINYRPIFNLEKKLDQILVITKDVTNELAAKLEAEHQKNIAKTILEICNSPKSFKDMLNSIHELNSEIKTMLVMSKDGFPLETEISYKRHVHTIKGSVSAFNLSSAVEQLHQYESNFEDEFEDAAKLKIAYNLVDFVDKFTEEIQVEFGTIIEKLLTTQPDELHIEKTHKNEFLKELVKYNNLSLIKMFKEKFILESLCEQFVQYNNVVKQTSDVLKKKILPIQISSEKIFVNAEYYKDFVTSCIHIFRNICDHGIETEDERIGLSKPAFGKIDVFAEKKEGQIRLIISDDGRGISKQKIKSKIKGTSLEKKYSSDLNILNCIFEPQFSTKDEVTVLSGRGVGLDAVLSELKKINGSVEVISEVGKGTQFIFTMPLIDEIKVENITHQKATAA